MKSIDLVWYSSGVKSTPQEGFLATQFPSGNSVVELSLVDDTVPCLPRRARAVRLGARVLASDPLVIGLRQAAIYEAGKRVRIAFSSASLDAARAEVSAQGFREAIVTVLNARGLAVGEEIQAALTEIQDPAILRPLVSQAATAASADEILATLRA